jgi:hypothetical protein
MVFGVLEWPDFNAATFVVGHKWKSGTLTLTEKRLVYGTAHTGSTYSDD